MPKEEDKTTKELLEEIQQFDVKSLARKEDLGKALNFEGAIEPAQKIVSLFKMISPNIFNVIPDQSSTTLRTHIETLNSRFNSILNLPPESQDFSNTRTELIKDLKNVYQQFFTNLIPFINYSFFWSEKKDDRIEETMVLFNSKFKEMESANKKSAEIITDMEKESKNLIEGIRKTAAEGGVTQESVHFKSESDSHDKLSGKWMKATILISVILILFLSLSIKYKWFTSESQSLSVTIQLVSTKVLIFGVLSYALFLSSRNFLSHKHNAIVNRHRQNALMTFEALASASGTKEGKEVILSHAAACIFAPQDTGYTKGDSPRSKMPPIFELLPKIAKGDE